MTSKEYFGIKATMEHVIVVLNVFERYSEADEVYHILFQMLFEYTSVSSTKYKQKFQKYFDLAYKIDHDHMIGFSL
mgnify:CR=1 FL=1